MKKIYINYKKIFWGIPTGLLLIYLALLIPPPEHSPQPPGEISPFIWDQDEYWIYLESSFVRAKELDSVSLHDSISVELERISNSLDLLYSTDLEPGSPALSSIEKNFFELCPLIGAQSEHLPKLIELRNKLRQAVKDQSSKWDMNSEETRDRLYRLLFGTRTAIEEVILQSPESSFPALTIACDEPSMTPEAEILGIKIHSGDILVSRGGAPTSALIARGNDYPGNFSHVALVHVDETTNEVSIIESHIECGVKLATIDQYLDDYKLRILVLRMRADTPQLESDPMLPHKAAEIVLNRALIEHIPYDFEMNFNDGGKLFCSEVASNAYSQMGVTLWMGISNISSSGVRSWLAAFGVKHFETQEPSDLEYDPQLRVVAEWYNPESLLKDHLDNAVIDIMLEDANNGEMLEYDWYKLPIARVAKAYSEAKNLCGGIGPIPEGMNAVAGLKNERFSKKHAAIKARLIRLAEEFEADRGYNPPYWEMVKLAKQARVEIE